MVRDNLQGASFGAGMLRDLNSCFTYAAFCLGWGGGQRGWGLGVGFDHVALTMTRTPVFTALLLLYTTCCTKMFDANMPTTLECSACFPVVKCIARVCLLLLRRDTLSQMFMHKCSCLCAHAANIRKRCYLPPFCSRLGCQDRQGCCKSLAPTTRKPKDAHRNIVRMHCAATPKFCKNPMFRHDTLKNRPCLQAGGFYKRWGYNPRASWQVLSCHRHMKDRKSVLFCQKCLRSETVKMKYITEQHTRELMLEMLLLLLAWFFVHSLVSPMFSSLCF